MRLMIRLQLMADERLEVVGEASSADEAVELARRTQPDLIILDHSIQGEVMGLDAAPRLKEVAPAARILLFTAFDLRAEATTEPTIDRFLPKGRFDELLGTVQEMLALDPAA